MLSSVKRFLTKSFYIEGFSYQTDMSSPCLSEVIQDFEKAFENEDDSDVIIKVGEGSDVKELRAHSFVLRARCPYFKAALSDDWEERDDDGNFILNKPNISFEVFQLILRYLYTGTVDFNQYNKNVYLQLLVAADELGLCNLIEYIQEYMFENAEIWHKDPVNTLQIIYKHETLNNLKDVCLEIISEDPSILFISEEFPLLEKQMIKMILQRDDLNMEEIDIWDSLLRWIFIHHLNIGKDDSTWSSANIKQIIQEFIPLIRFYDISKEDFYLKVFPYKDLMPRDLLNDILRYHMVPNSTPTLNFKPSRSKTNSDLINYNVFKLFAKWIDKKDGDYTRQNIPYKFDLLLRGTRDGFDCAKFHQLCDNKGATLVIARIKDSNQIVGGYNPLYWSSSNGYLNTYDSFLFKLTDTHNLKSAEIGRVAINSNAIYDYSGYGPTFGVGGNDLTAQENNWYANNNSYTNINIPTSFTIDEYEVFQVLKKY